jgi:hypothetical protein
MNSLAAGMDPNVSLDGARKLINQVDYLVLDMAS